MKLLDLRGELVGDLELADNGRVLGWRHVETMAEAQGVMFQCPKCAVGAEAFTRDGKSGYIGVHYVLCWFKEPMNGKEVPDDLDPKPGRWHAVGDTIDNITFTGPGAYSVLLTSGCGWHGYVANGETSDCP